MEFTEIGKELGGLNADQVFNLAQVGKDILEISGNVSLALSLMEAVAFLSEEENLREAASILLSIAQIMIKLDEKCWCEHKTLLGVTGVDIDDLHYGLGGVPIITGKNDEQSLNIKRKSYLCD